MTAEPVYVRMVDKRGRVGHTLHIIQIDPSRHWRGRTYCGILGEPVEAPPPPQGRDRVCPRCRRAAHD